MKGWTSNTELFEIAFELGINLDGVFQKDELIECEIGSYIINLQDSVEGTGTHWVALFKPNKKVSFYFDSFGISPPFDVIDKCMTDELYYNDVRVQGLDEGYCGQWSLLFLGEMQKGKKYLNNYNKFIKKFIQL